MYMTYFIIAFFKEFTTDGLTYSYCTLYKDPFCPFKLWYKSYIQKALKRTAR